MKVATIETVETIKPHPVADTLDLVYTTNQLFGITGKEEYKVGDRVIYIRPGTKIPLNLVSPLCFKYTKKGRVKPVMLRGILSPGLIINTRENLPNGSEVSRLVGIKNFKELDGDVDELIDFLADYIEHQTEILNNINFIGAFICILSCLYLIHTFLH